MRERGSREGEEIAVLISPFIFWRLEPDTTESGEKKRETEGERERERWVCDQRLWTHFTRKIKIWQQIKSLAIQAVKSFSQQKKEHRRFQILFEEQLQGRLSSLETEPWRYLEVSLECYVPSV